MQTAQELQHAIQRHESYVDVDPDNLLLRLTLGDLYHQAGRMSEANACYDHCLLQTPGDAIARSRLASVMISQHRFAEAEQSLRALIAGGDADASLLHNLGLALYYQRRWDDARNCFAQAIEQGIASADALAYLARTLHHMGMMTEAIDAARRWTDVAQDSQSKSYLSLLYMDNNDVERSSKLAREVLVHNPDNIDANVVAGMASAGEQDVGPARLHFETALRQDRENGRAWLGLGLVQLYQQEHAQAVESLGHATRIFPGNAGIMVSFGWAKLASKDAAGAQEVFEQALRVDRTFAESHGGLASALAFQHKFERAEQEIKLARRLDPSGFGADFAETTILAVQGQTQAATDLFDRMLLRSPPGGMLPLIEQLRVYATRHGEVQAPQAPDLIRRPAPAKQLPGRSAKPNLSARPRPSAKPKHPTRKKS
jgi:tetratricopeptide (TPR) repeat protein